MRKGRGEVAAGFGAHAAIVDHHAPRLGAGDDEITQAKLHDAPLIVFDHALVQAAIEADGFEGEGGVDALRAEGPDQRVAAHDVVGIDRGVEEGGLGGLSQHGNRDGQIIGLGQVFIDIDARDAT